MQYLISIVKDRFKIASCLMCALKDVFASCNHLPCSYWLSRAHFGTGLHVYYYCRLLRSTVPILCERLWILNPISNTEVALMDCLLACKQEELLQQPKTVSSTIVSRQTWKMVNFYTNYNWIHLSVHPSEVHTLIYLTCVRGQTNLMERLCSDFWLPARMCLTWAVVQFYGSPGTERNI